MLRPWPTVVLLTY